jgi:hypothetical protein
MFQLRYHTTFHDSALRVLQEPVFIFPISPDYISFASLVPFCGLFKENILIKLETTFYILLSVRRGSPAFLGDGQLR